MRRITRARYHRAIRHIEKNANTIRMGKMANALLSNKSRNVWSECAKMKGKNCKMASMIDGNSDSCSIAGMFFDKYAALYNSVSEMKHIRHGLSPNSMILGTMIPISKDKKKSLCSASNYRAIALSSIFSKMLDWIILLKEHSLCSSELQFGFKNYCLPRNALSVC